MEIPKPQSQQLDGDISAYVISADKIVRNKADYRNWLLLQNSPSQVTTLIPQEADHRVLEGNKRRLEGIKAATVITLVFVLLGLGTVGYSHQEQIGNAIKNPGSILNSVGRKKDQIFYDFSQATTPDILK